MLRRFLRLGRRPSDADIARELRDHLDLEAEELARSSSPGTASDRARRRFGNPMFVAETVRDVWRFAWLDQMGQDLRHAWRGLRRSPVYAVSATLTLSLGVGAVVAVFGMVDPIIDHPYPSLPEDRLVWISEPSTRCPTCDGASPAAFQALRERHGSLEAVAATTHWRTSLRIGNGSEIVDGYLVSANLFRTISAPFALGGSFSADADQPGRPRTVILSYRFWRDRFGGRAAVLDSTVTLGGEPYTVVGILAPHVIFPTEVSVYAPLVLSSQALADHGGRYLGVFGRLKDGAPLEAATVEAHLVAAQLALEAPKTDSLSTLSVQPLRAFHTSDVRILLLVFGIAAAMVLVASCVSLANLGFARLTGRRRDIAVRAALGGQAVRIALHLFGEALLIAGAAGILGLALAAAGAHAMRQSIPAAFARYSPGWANIGVGGRAVVFALLVCVASTLLFALFPAIRAIRTNLSSVLTDSARGSIGVRSSRLRSALVVVQVSVALALLSCATLLTRSVREMLGGDPGVRREHLLSMHLTLPPTMSDSAVRSFVDRLDARLHATPGILGAGLTSTTPLSNNWWGTTFQIPGRPPVPGAELTANDQRITPDYFHAMGIRLLNGRGIESRDVADGQRVAVINHFMNEQLYPGQDPVGRVLSIDSMLWTIVGVVADVRHGGFDEPMRYEIYRSAQQAIQRDGDLDVWTAGDPAAMRDVVQRAVAATDPTAAIGELMTMREIEAQHISPFALLAAVLMVFAAVTTVIAIVALYGIIAYGVTQQRREIGVRIALGAQRSSIARHVAAAALRLTGVGLAIGAVGAIAFAQVVKSMLYGVGPTDLVTLLASAAALLAVALAAALPPALVAAAVDPVVALREG